jgi:hypothetical protein
MRVFMAALGILILCACTNRRDSDRKDSELYAASLETYPVAVLDAGTNPLWFQFGPDGPEQLVTIEDACLSRALIPWPLAAHSRFMLAHNDEIIMAINGDGFLVFSPWDIPSGGNGTALYRFSGGALWQPYTVAALVFIDEIPAALLYRDDRFLDARDPLPDPRVWTFTMNTAAPFASDIPALHLFPGHEGWDIDALRFSSDGCWYFRAIKKDRGEQEIKYMRSVSLDTEGEIINSGIFFNSVQPEPLASSPVLSSLPGIMDSPGIVMVISPEFDSQRYFSHNFDSMVNTLAYFRSSPFSALIINSLGNGFYTAGETPVPAAPEAIPHYVPLALPRLPENFAYTGIALSGETIIAAWEEQEAHTIGAAGFMALRLP